MGRYAVKIPLAFEKYSLHLLKDTMKAYFYQRHTLL